MEIIKALATSSRGRIASNSSRGRVVYWSEVGCYSTAYGDSHYHLVATGGGSVEDGSESDDDALDLWLAQMARTESARPYSDVRRELGLG